MFNLDVGDILWNIVRFPQNIVMDLNNVIMIVFYN